MRWDKKKRTVSDMFLRLHICEKLCGPSLWQQGLHIHRGNTILWLPGLQLSVFIFLGAVVPLLGLLGQLPAILGFIIVVSSALIVCWPIGSLRIRAGPECAHTQNSDVMWSLSLKWHWNLFFLWRKGERSHPIGCGRLMFGFGNLTGTA